MSAHPEHAAVRPNSEHFREAAKRIDDQFGLGIATARQMLMSSAWTKRIYDCCVMALAQALADSDEARTPEGWRIVPPDATPAMLDAWIRADTFEEGYRALLDAVAEPGA